MKRLVVSAVLLAFSLHGASAESLRAYQVEMEARLAAIERRLEQLEQDRAGAQAAERQSETERQRDAAAQLAATCSAFRNNPAAVKLFNDCKKMPPNTRDCLIVGLDELTCH